MKKLLIVLFFTNISNAQMTRAEILEMAVTLDWKIESAASNKISITAFKSENELGILPLQYSELTFDGSSQSSKLIKVREVKSTKVKYVAEANFKDAPRVKESRVINSYKGEKYCSCYYYFKNARVRVTKYPVKVENKTAFYYKEYEVQNYYNANSSSGNTYEGTTISSGSYRAKETARKFVESTSVNKYIYKGAEFSKLQVEEAAIKKGMSIDSYVKKYNIIPIPLSYRYSLNNKIHNIPASQVDSWVKKNPSAKPYDRKLFLVNGEKYLVSPRNFEKFLKKFPEAEFVENYSNN